MPHRASKSPAAAVLTVVLLAAATLAAADPGETCQRYGAGVTLDEPTPVAKIVARPEAWAGRTVRVEGVVHEVCLMAGCWLTFVPEPGDPELRVKVEDGEIVFPPSTRGQLASAQGVVEVKEMTREQYVEWLAHLAEEQGRAFDEDSVGEEPYRQVQVKATGAEICRDGGEAEAG